MTTDLTAQEIEELKRLEKAATTGPWRKHDHDNMALVGEDPAKWIGYAWVGQITKNSEPDGRFDSMVTDMDRRKDGHEPTRLAATHDAEFIAAARNALPRLLAMVERLRKQADNAGNYVADDDTHPEMVMFADGRIVAISHTDEEPYLVVSRKRERDMTGVLTAIGKERSEAWASIESSYQEAAALRTELATLRTQIAERDVEINRQKSVINDCYSQIADKIDTIRQLKEDKR